MSLITRAITAIGFANIIGFPFASSWALDLGVKANLQATMQRHIQHSSVDGAFLYLQPDNGAVRRLHPITPHPIIMKMGQHFVLCFDFRDTKGKSVEIDFYLARKKNSFVVFHTAIENRALLRRLMKAGKAERAG